MKIFFAGLVLVLAGAANGLSENLEFKDGDHISIIGNALADRMQHDGWLEALLEAHFPDRHLSIRNLGFACDELTVRLRCENFGSQDDWLTRTKADVVFAFFGYNESFAGPNGLGKFKQDLEKFIHNTLDHQYNGHSAPRLVLFSPTAHENLHNPNLPDGTTNNQRLKLYTEAISEVANQHKLPFVDLFAPSMELYVKASKPLTIDCVHMSENGNRLLAPVIVHGLFPATAKVKQDAARVEKIRQAVVDKNFYWFNRYRTVDGYNVYGGRSQLKYVDNISNWDVLQR